MDIKNKLFECPELSWMCLVLQIHLVSLVDSPPIIGSQGGRRERYPLTSQLIEENKIPEFGLSAQHLQIQCI